MVEALPEGEEAPGLASRAREGDREAFEALYERFAPMVHAVLLSSVKRAEVDDLVQDVFFAAWRGIGRLREAEHFGAWLCTIARNRARGRWRRRPAFEPLPDGLAGRPSTGEGAEVLNVLRTLPEAYRETLAMRLVEGMSGPEIAEATGLTHGSVRVNLHRGMQLLRERLREEGWS